MMTMGDQPAKKKKTDRKYILIIRYMLSKNNVTGELHWLWNLFLIHYYLKSRNDAILVLISFVLCFTYVNKIIFYGENMVHLHH